MDAVPRPYQLSTRRAEAYAVASQRWHVVITTLGHSVKELRQLLGWSQMRLAERAIVSQGAVSRVEAGIDNVPFRTVAQLLQVLGHAADQSGLQLSPSSTALLAFVDPLIGSILAAEIDPQFATLAHAYHRLSDPHQRAITTFIDTLAGPAPEPLEPEPEYSLSLPPPVA